MLEEYPHSTPPLFPLLFPPSSFPPPLSPFLSAPFHSFHTPAGNFIEAEGRDRADINLPGYQLQLLQDTVNVAGNSEFIVLYIIIVMSLLHHSDVIVYIIVMSLFTS